MDQQAKIAKLFHNGLAKIDSMLGTKGTLLKTIPPSNLKASATSREIEIDIIKWDDEQMDIAKTNNVESGDGSPRQNTKSVAVGQNVTTWRIRGGQTDADGMPVVPEENDRLKVEGQVMNILNVKKSSPDAKTPHVRSYVVECAS